MKIMQLPDKIINLIKKTGEKCIIVNPNSGTAFVLLSFEEYLNLVEKKENHLTGDKELDKINSAIAMLADEEKKNEQGDEVEFLQKVPVMAENSNVVNNTPSSEEEFYFEPIDQ